MASNTNRLNDLSSASGRCRPENEKGVSAVVLASFSLFRELDQATREIIAQRFKLRQYAKGQYVISENQPNREVYFLVSGTVHACAFSHNGKQVQFEALTPGMMFGELAAIDGKERSSDCIASTNATIATIDASDFHQLIDEYQSVRHEVIQRLAFMVRMHMRKLYELTTFPVGQRVRFELLRIASNFATQNAEQDIIKSTDEEKELVDQSDVVLTKVPTHAEIAARIGTHREAVTRELKSLESDGVITWRPGSYVIHDLAALTASVKALN